MADVADRLARRTLELVDIPSESRREAEIAERVASLVPPGLGLETAVDGASFWASAPRDGAPFVVLAGHYDTVPAQDNLPGRIADGSVHGLGASDMKGGVAVALEIAGEVDV